MTNYRKLSLWIALIAVTFYPVIAVVCFTGPEPNEGWLVLGCVALLMVVAIGYWRVNR